MEGDLVSAANNLETIASKLGTLWELNVNYFDSILLFE